VSDTESPEIQKQQNLFWKLVFFETLMLQITQKNKQLFGLAMFFQFKSETLFRLKFISDSIQVKHCEIEKKR
jgi:hypothetical protein